MDFISDAYPPNSKPFLDTFIECIENKLGECRDNDLEKIACSLLRLNFYPTKRNESLARNLMTAIGVHNKYRETFKFGKSFVFFNEFMATLGYYRSDFVRDIFEKVNSSVELKEADTLEDITKSGILTISGIGPYTAKHGISQSFLINEFKLSRSSYQGALASIAKLDCLLEINFPEYQGIRLERNIKRKLLSLLRKQPEHAIEFKNTNCILYTICKVLNIRVQDEDKCVYHGFLSPDSTTRDIVFCVDLRSSKCNDIKLLPLPREYKHDLNEGMKIVRPQKYLIFNEDSQIDTAGGDSNHSKDQVHKWFAVVSPRQKFHHKMRTSDFYGPFNFKVARIKKLGYHVITMPYDVLENIWREDRKGQTQIRKLLNEHCVM